MIPWEFLWLFLLGGEVRGNNPEEGGGWNPNLGAIVHALGRVNIGEAYYPSVALPLPLWHDPKEIFYYRSECIILGSVTYI
jgi:hypothetical protein